MARRLTDQEKRFADEYLMDFDAKNAALRAGYKLSVARNAANWIGGENPSKPELRELIDKKEANNSRRLGYSVDRIRRELAAIAFGDFTDAVDPATGFVRTDLSREDSAAIAAVRMGRKGECEVRMHDKVKALELLGKHLGMFEDKLKVENAVPVLIVGDDDLDD